MKLTQRRGPKGVIALALLGAVWFAAQEGPTRTESSAVGGVMPASSPALQEPFAVEYGGCASSLEDDLLVCTFEPSRGLTLWVPNASAAQISVAIDDRHLSAEASSLYGEIGTRLHVRPPDDGNLLEVRVDGTPSWSLRVRSSVHTTPSHRARLEELRTRSAASERAIIQASGELSQRSALEGATALLSNLLAEGALGLAIDFVAAVTFHLGYTRDDPDAARRWLADQESRVLQLDPRARYVLVSSRGLVEATSGNSEAAARAFLEAMRFGLRTGDEDIQAESVSMYAALLPDLGHYVEAERWGELAVALGDDSRRCELAALLRNLGWQRRETLRAGEPTRDPRVAIVEAIAWAEHGECEDLVSGAWLDLATLSLLRNQVEEAHRQLEQVDPSHLSAAERSDFADIELRLLLEQSGGPQSIDEALEKLTRATHELESPPLTWRLHTRRGQVFEARGELASARAEYAAAERELDELMKTATFGSSRATMATRTELSSRGLVEVLLALGEIPEAVCAARRSIARPALGVVVERRVPRERVSHLWRAYEHHRRVLSAQLELAGTIPYGREDELRAAAEAQRLRLLAVVDELAGLGVSGSEVDCGAFRDAEDQELVVVVFGTDPRWHLLARFEDQWAAHLVESDRPFDLSDERRSELLLGPLDDWLSRARRIRFIVASESRAQDLHMLPWRGRPLVASKVVTYGIDLPPSDSANQSRSAFVVVDPTRSLPGARDDGQRVIRHLRSLGFEVTSSLEGCTTPGCVRTVLVDADHLHFAGHGRRPSSPTVGPWPPYPAGAPGHSSYLELSEGLRLEPFDILTLPRVPRTVTLLGCHTGVFDRSQSDLSIALAFLAAGAQSVIAASSAVDDQVASRLGSILYDGVEPGAELDTAAQLHRAIAELIAHDPSPELRSELGKYRVWVR